MRKNVLSFLYILVLLFILGYGFPSIIYATEDTTITETNEAGTLQNTETGYQILLEDNADLLSPLEEQKLIKTMEPITAYGNVAFVSITFNTEYSTKSYAEHYYQEHFGYNSGILFLIDMDLRYLWIYSYGDIYHTITTAYANSITDNVYSYASNQDYFTCASKAFEQINTLLEGRYIAQPMKYISNALLAIVVALLINYFLVMTSSRSRKASNSQLLNGTFFKTEIKNSRMELVNQTRRHSPQNRSSVHHKGRSSGSFRAGGRGGSFRGGGGGHRF